MKRTEYVNLFMELSYTKIMRTKEKNKKTIIQNKKKKRNTHNFGEA